MLDAHQRDIARRFLEAKAGWSAWNDNAASFRGAPRTPVRKFQTVEAAVHYYKDEKGNPYTGDPFWGAGDLYLHPQRLQAYLDNPPLIGKPPIDCDDVAAWYWHAVAGAPGVTDLRMVTLIDPTFTFANRSHVILAGRANGRPFTLDTNGLFWQPDTAEDTLIRCFSTLYMDHGYQYAAALDTPYPWAP